MYKNEIINEVLPDSGIALKIFLNQVHPELYEMSGFDLPAKGHHNQFPRSGVAPHAAHPTIRCKEAGLVPPVTMEKRAAEAGTIIRYS